jgi:hypothetical protein
MPWKKEDDGLSPSTAPKAHAQHGAWVVLARPNGQRTWLARTGEQWVGSFSSWAKSCQATGSQAQPIWTYIPVH